MRKAGFVTVAIFLQRRKRNGSNFWLPAVGHSGRLLPVLLPFLLDLLHVLRILRPGAAFFFIFLLSHFAPGTALLVKQANRRIAAFIGGEVRNMIGVAVWRQHGFDLLAGLQGDSNDLSIAQSAPSVWQWANLDFAIMHH